MNALVNYLRNDNRTLASTVTLLRRRRAVAPGAVAMPYVRAERALLLTLGGLSLVESVVFSFAKFPAMAHMILWFADGYTVLFTLGLLSSMITRPHTVSPEELRIRFGHYLDVRVPMGAVSSFRYEKKTYDAGAYVRFSGEEFMLVLDAETNVVVELTEPIAFTRPLGKQASARVIAFYADDPAAAAEACRDALSRHSSATG
ncbi:hypothetical protein [Amycolatopsis sp. CA-230715]|uniref:hypothetical protein n=1 Tax=Amycolatopsis sp. CA-230715 TaxID=2745196 RepID=UPI001C00AD63|nr:hypothetical protein [Amycolatopsis sp. CA-230715]QWF82807.1 hypothetical protein HUW46_06246 [Amycolatopsis sp. CA-230715]